MNDSARYEMMKRLLRDGHLQLLIFDYDDQAWRYATSITIDEALDVAIKYGLPRRTRRYE